MKKELPAPDNSGPRERTQTDDALSTPKVSIGEDGQMMPVLAEGEYIDDWRKRLPALFGVQDELLALDLLSRTLSGALRTGAAEEVRMNSMIAAINEMNPRDSLEAMLASQLVCVYQQNMGILARATEVSSPDLRQLYLNLSIKLIRSFTALTGCLRKYRQKGEQKMTVEHVHVHDGGQAIVGNVSTRKERDNAE